ALVGALSARGHQIDVVGLPWRGYLRALAGGVAGRARPRARRSARSSAPPSARYDAVIHDELVHRSVLAHARRLAPGAVALALVHNLTCEQPGQRLRALVAALERRFLAGVDGFVAVCQRTADGVRALAGPALPGLVARPGRDHVAPGVDEALVAERSRAPGPLRVLHAAALVPAKGLDRLLDALARLAA